MKTLTDKSTGPTGRVSASTANKMARHQDNAEVQSDPILFVTSRAREYLDPTSLGQLIGTGPSGWPLALLKELIDNGIDACEGAGIAPVIEVRLRDRLISVADNGPGLPERVISHALNFDVRASSKSHLIAPTRGRQGNALKCALAAPAVAPLDERDERGFADIEAHGKKWRIRIQPDAESVIYNPVQILPSTVKNGTKITLHWLSRPWSEDDENDLNFTTARSVVEGFALCNPHVRLILRSGEGNRSRADFIAYEPTATELFSKWSAKDGSSPHWYELADLKKLVVGYAAALAKGEPAPRTVRDFVGTFVGLSGSVVKARVASAAGMGGKQLADLIGPAGIDDESIRCLLGAMKAEARTIAAKALGRIGREHLLHSLGGGATFDYKEVRSDKGDGRPFVVEAAFAIPDPTDARRRVGLALNWTPLPTTAFREFTKALDENLVDDEDTVCLFVHVACPRPGAWEDTGKMRMDLDSEVAHAIRKAVTSVTRQWRKIKKKRRRDAHVRSRQLGEVRRQLVRGNEGRIRDLIFQMIPDAYREASGSVRMAKARQVMYSCRRRVLATIEAAGIEGKFVKDKTFTGSILPKYVAENPITTQGWDIIYDARGHFTEPHTGKIIPIGTKKIREYVAAFTSGAPKANDPFAVSDRLPTIGPINRFTTVLFCEKEGFDEIIEASGITRKYDVALMSTKGMSVTAARSLVEELSDLGVAILVLHDFDKSGFSILHTLCHDTSRYKFRSRPNVIDIGLRLADIQEMGLESEPVEYQRQRKSPADRLEDCGATEEECEFLVREQTDATTWVGHRVELNAMDSDRHVAFLERKFVEHGVRKVIPDPECLAQAHADLSRRLEAKRKADEVMEQSNLSLPIPPLDLPDRVAELLRINPQWPWDRAVRFVIEKANSQATTPCKS